MAYTREAMPRKHVSYDLVLLTGTGVTSFFALPLHLLLRKVEYTYSVGKKTRTKNSGKYLNTVREHKTNLNATA